MSQHLNREIIEPAWQKKLAELDGDDLRKEAETRLKAAAEMTHRDCRDLFDMIGEVGERWKNLAGTWDDFCITYTGKPASFINSIVAGVRNILASGHNGPIP